MKKNTTKLVACPCYCQTRTRFRLIICQIRTRQASWKNKSILFARRRFPIASKKSEFISEMILQSEAFTFLVHEGAIAICFFWVAFLALLSHFFVEWLEHLGCGSQLLYCFIFLEYLVLLGGGLHLFLLVARPVRKAFHKVFS